jgi:hypothetical protein
VIIEQPLRTALVHAAATVVDDVTPAAATLPDAIHGLDAARAIQLLGNRTHALDVVEETFSQGRRVSGTLRPLDARGATGQLYRAQFQHPTDPSIRVDAVLKHNGRQREAFGWQIARALDIDHLVPPTTLRNDEHAAIGLVEGQTFTAAGIEDAAGLRAALRSYHEGRGLQPAAADEAAALDHELLAFMDWFTANRDRKLDNAMLAADGSIAFIDNAGMLRGELADALRPRLKPMLYPTAADGSARITLSDAARERIRTGLTRRTIEDAQQLLRSHPDESGTMERRLLEQASSPGELDRLLQRLDHAVDHGVLEYQPVTARSRIEDAAALQNVMNA